MIRRSVDYRQDLTNQIRLCKFLVGDTPNSLKEKCILCGANTPTSTVILLVQVATVAGLAWPHVAFLGALRHRTRVDVVQDVYWRAGGICWADVQAAMTVAPPRVCALMAGLSWVPWLLMHHRCASPPSQSPISLTQARWGCKPAINNTQSTHALHSHLQEASEFLLHILFY